MLWMVLPMGEWSPRCRKGGRDGPRKKTCDRGIGALPAPCFRVTLRCPAQRPRAHRRELSPDQRSAGLCCECHVWEPSCARYCGPADTTAICAGTRWPTQPDSFNTRNSPMKHSLHVSVAVIALVFTGTDF